MDLAKEGAAALDAKDYKKAIDCYSRALVTFPTSVDYYIKRSTAHQRSTPPNFSDAYADAETALVLAQKRAKRELIVQAQLRRGIALFGLERYADAGFVIDIVKRMDPKEKTLAIWENKIQSKLSGLPEGDLKRIITVKESPDAEKEKRQNVVGGGSSINGTSNGASSQATPAVEQFVKPSAVQTPADKIRHDWYQTGNDVYVTLLAKGVSEDKAQIDIEEHSLSVSFPAPGSAGNEMSTYELTFDPLFASIDVQKSTSRITASKVEIVLKKAQPNQKWHALESNEPVTKAADVSGATKSLIPSSILQPSAQASAPSYPTSSRSGPKNWDKLATELTTKKSDKSTTDSTDGNTKTGTDDDDYDYDKEDGDEVNGFFKKLYAGASPEVQRAMMKSYTESNGTALSTNWEEVSKGKVETSPPTGMEARKWEQ